VLCRRSALSGAGVGAGGRQVAVWLAGFGVLVAAAVAYRLVPRAPALSEGGVAAAGSLLPESATDAARGGFAGPLSSTRPAIDPAHAEQLRALQALGRSSDPPRMAALVARASSAPPPAAIEHRPAMNELPVPHVHVLVYTTSWCPVCKKAKRGMASSGVPYEERDVEASSADARQMRQINPRGSVPTFDVDGEVLVGFSPDGLIATMKRAAAHQELRQPW
jgi:glutaredoxin